MIKSFLVKIYYSLPSSMILMFHHVGVHRNDRISSCEISMTNFENICKRFSSVSGKIEDSISKNKIVSFTFDDGFSDFYYNAYPLLVKYNIPFTIFIIEEFIGKPGYLSLKQILTISKHPLAEIGSHGLSHKLLTELSDEDLKKEILNTKRSLESKIGRSITKFAYSHGQFDIRCKKLITVYNYAFAADSKPINFFTRSRRYSFPRINITDDSINKYHKLFKKFSV